MDRRNSERQYLKKTLALKRGVKKGGDMNKKQKVVFLVGVGIIVVMGLIPPWHLEVLFDLDQQIPLTVRLGYGFLFSPPTWLRWGSNKGSTMLCCSTFHCPFSTLCAMGRSCYWSGWNFDCFKRFAKREAMRRIAPVLSLFFVIAAVLGHHSDKSLHDQPYSSSHVNYPSCPPTSS